MWPIKYILACRRLLYLQKILHREPDELIQRVYLAQRTDSSEGDFCQIVDNDRQLLDIWLSDDQITNMSVYELKTLVRRKAFQHFREAIIC